MKSCENCGNFDRTNNKGTEACGECQTIEPTQWKPTRTNGDRIRAMSDEELADNWMKDYIVCHRCAYVEECECDEYVTIEKCKEGLLEWLKQPMEVEE